MRAKASLLVNACRLCPFHHHAWTSASFTCVRSACVAQSDSGVGVPRSSNIDAAISTGSIFGIYDPNDACSLEDMDDPTKMVENCVLNVCQPGGRPLHVLLSVYSCPWLMQSFSNKLLSNHETDWLRPGWQVSPSPHETVHTVVARL